MKKLLTTITLCLTLIFTSALPILASDSNINETNFLSVTTTSTNTKVLKVTLNTKNENIIVGSTTTLIPTVYPSTAINKDVTWKSSNEAIATVDSTGNVTGLKAGKVTITVTTVDRKKTATCKVTVNAPIVNVTGVSLNKSVTTMSIGDNETLSATLFPVNATNKNVTWKSSNKAIATVDKNGKVVGLSSGSSDITVTSVDGSKTATCKVTVIPVTITSASVANGTVTVTLSTSGLEYHYSRKKIPVIADFAITASGKAVKPTAISATYEIVTLTVPPANDQFVVYNISYKGGDPVIANIKVSNITSNNIKVGQHFNVLLQEYGSVAPPWQGMNWTFTTNNDAIKLVQTTKASNVPLAGGGPLVIRTFQATQTGSFTLHFSRETPPGNLVKRSETFDYIINVT